MGFGIDITSISDLISAAHTTTDALVNTVDAVADAIKLKTDNLPASPADEAGLVAAVKAKTDNLPADPADQSDLEDILARKYPFLDFWAHPAADKITVTSTAQDIVFPSIVVAGLPSGLTLVRVVFILSVADLKDTSGSDNYINAASKSIRIMLSGGAWGTNDIIALTLDNQALFTTGSGERGGPVLYGPDLKATVNANGTWEVQSRQTTHGDALVALGNDLEFFDVEVGLRFWYH